MESRKICKWCVRNTLCTDLDRRECTVLAFKNYEGIDGLPIDCAGCKHHELRLPWPAMFPCASCKRAYKKDYFEHEED